ncbi:acyltransferase family protein, partial [Leucobacter sp. M11]|uniref:acyltransferase family protein n=1 Tax=Leucobacter sp. M11 TaxID=2993565 RepID=UPI002D7FC183
MSIAPPRVRAAAAPPAARRPQGSPATRDAGIDLLRAALIPVVVALHAMMVGIGHGPDGPLLGNATDGQAWFAPVTWVVQIMPLFFLIGGYASITHWRKLRGRGATPADYIAARARRLLGPGLLAIGGVTLGLAALTAAGVAPDIVATAGFRISQPLWFLAVYLGCSALVPLTVRWHEARPGLSLAALAVAAVVIDALRFGTGIEAIGIINLVPVWLTIQQLGYWLADGRFDRIRTRNRALLAAAGLGATLLLVSTGPYSADLLVNLNPPTVVLITFGVAQLFLFTLFRPALGRWAARPLVARITGTLAPRAMTIYLWHMPAIIALSGALLLSGIELPQPLSVDWWLSRPAWLVLVGVAVAITVRLVGT